MRGVDAARQWGSIVRMAPSLSSAAGVSDLRRAARGYLPGFVFDFIDGGAGDEATVRANRADLERIALRMRVLQGAGAPSLATTILGRPAQAPIMIAPTGAAGMVRHKGELHGLRAASAAGIPFCLTTMSSITLEEVAAAAPHADRWFQLYVTRDRALCRKFVARAKAAGYRVLMPTVDVPAQGHRKRDIRSGYTMPPRFTWRTVRDVALRPFWARDVLLRDVLLGGGPRYANFESEGKGIRGAVSVAKAVSAQLDPALTPADIAWLKEIWQGPLVVKGVLDPADAEACVRAGADGIVVSNHGGRQLDGGIGSIRALAPIVDRVGGRAEVFLDGGISGGADVLRALALGARAVLVGRAWLWGMAAGGQPGVARMLDLLADEMRISLMMMGKDNVQLGRDAVISPREFLEWPNA
jgi:L-lactate dehydrogenase (cytochrome)